MLGWKKSIGNPFFKRREEEEEAEEEEKAAILRMKHEEGVENVSATLFLDVSGCEAI